MVKIKLFNKINKRSANSADDARTANESAKLKFNTKHTLAQKYLAIIGGSTFAMALISTIAMAALGGGITNSSQQKANADTISDTLAPIDAAKISLSITNSTGSSSSSSPDISITSPSGGGIATGYHTLNISLATPGRDILLI